MPLLALVFAAAGAGIGFAADRLAARWPAHEDGSVRRVDWRTGAAVITGALGLGALPLRWSDPADLALLGAYFVALVVLMATDLDQKLLPDVITIPMAVIALVILGLTVTNLYMNPLLESKGAPLFTALAAGIGAPALLAGTSLVLRGGIGMGDLKLAISLGLMSGITRLFAGFLVASAASSVVILALVASRRIGFKSAIPFGPVLIAGGMIAALIQ